MLCVKKQRGINMRLLAILIFIILVFLSLTSCSTLSSPFTTKNIMKIHQGMSSDEILALFGEPKNIRADVCGMTCSPFFVPNHEGNLMLFEQ